MYSELKEIRILEETLSYLYRTSSEDLVNIFISEVKENLKFVNNIVNNDIRKLNDTEFFKIIDELYSIYLLRKVII